MKESEVENMVNRKPLEVVRVLFATGSNTLALLSVLGGIYAVILKSMPGTGLLLAVAAYAFLTSCTRNFVGRPLPFLLLHLFPLPLFWAGMAGTNRIFTLAAGIAVCIYSLVKKFRRDEVTEPIHVAILFGILWVIYLITRKVVGTDAGELQVLFAYLGIACFLGEWYLSRFIQYMEMEGRTNADIPEKKLFQQGGMLAFAYSAFLLFSVILFTSESLAEKVGAWFSHGLQAIFLFLLSLLPRGSEETVEEITQGNHQLSMLPEMMGNESAEPFMILVILEKIMTVAVVILIVALCAYGVYFVIHHFLEAFQKEKDQEDRVEDLRLEEKQERLEKRKGIENLRRFLGFLTPAEKIRRSYQKLVERTASGEELERAGRQSVREYLHGRTKEAEEKDRKEQEKAAECFAKLYEKARYSGKDCDARESSEAAALARTLSNR